MIKTEWVKALREVEYRNWDYGIYGAIDYEYLQITFETTESDGTYKSLWCEINLGHVHNDRCYSDMPKYKKVKQYCRKWRLENRFTVSDIIRTAWLATSAAEEHEARERFKYKGKSIFGPHFDVDALVEIAKSKENLDLREEAMV